MGKAIIAALPADKVCDVWSQVAPMLQRAIDHNQGEETLGDVRERIDSGEALLLVAMERGVLAAFVAEMISFPRRKVCGITLCGGRDADKWLATFLDDIKRIAKEQGADSVRLIGRRGWVRKLAPFGWNEVYTVVEVGL